MEPNTLGRRNRRYYWLGLIGIVGVMCLMHYAVNRGTIWLHLLLMLLFATRCHDFNMPTGAAVLLWATLHIALPVGSTMLQVPLGLSDTALGLLVLPTLLAHLVVGFVPGTRGVNRHGVTGQGFSALKPQEQIAQPTGGVLRPRTMSPEVILPQRREAFGMRR